MIVYHRTDAAEAILREGFRERTAGYLTDTMLTGVWVSDIPLDCNEGCKGDQLLALEMPAEVFAAHEMTDDNIRYREAILPANILNSYGPPRIVGEEEETEISNAAWERALAKLDGKS
jgi:hypothetical protein